jgi:uncharacterized protein YkwD
LVTAAPSQAAAGVCWNPHNAESGFAQRINSARALQGLGKLQLDPELSKAARVHTREMARKASLFHTPSWRLRDRVTNWIILGENVGVGGTVTSLHSAFMNSPAHRSNVLHGTFRHVGVGTILRGGRLWVTVIFEGLTDPSTPLRMPTC